MNVNYTYISRVVGDTIEIDIKNNGTLIGTKSYSITTNTVEDALKSVKFEGDNFGFSFNGNFYPAQKNNVVETPVVQEEQIRVPQTFLEGYVLDATGSALAGVKVQILSQPDIAPTSPLGGSGISSVLDQTPSLNLEINSSFKIIQDTVTTDNEGKWSKAYPTTDLNLKKLTLTYTKKDFELKTIKNPQITNVADGNTLVEIPRTLLQPVPDIIPLATQKILSQLNLNELESLKRQSDSNLPFQIKLANNVNLKKEDLKRIIIPYALQLLLPFGMVALQAVLDKLPAVQIEDLIDCPSKNTILTLTEKRNKLARQINNMYSTVRTLNTTVLGVNTTITAIQAGITFIQTIPYPATGVPPLGLPPLTTGTIETIGLVVDGLSRQLERAQIAVNILTLSLASFGILLGTILSLLNVLDRLLQKCSQEENIPFEQINNEINLLANQSQEIAQTQDNLTYKGFKLELKLDEENRSQYPRRFAQALNRQGVPVLKTESSFASNPQVLLDQLRFIIDSNPNLTAE
jgi:sulfur carrier protein ThiS